VKCSKSWDYVYLGNRFFPKAETRAFTSAQIRFFKQLVYILLPLESWSFGVVGQPLTLILPASPNFLSLAASASAGPSSNSGRLLAKFSNFQASAVYTSKRFGDEYETLHDIYQNLAEVDENLPRKQPPTLEQVASTYEKIIKPDWKLSISDVEYINIKTGAGIIAKLRFEGRDILINKNWK